MSDAVFDFAFNARFSAGANRFTLNISCRSDAARLAVVGPSGAGKSLMLQLLAGLQRPQSGHVNIAGRCYGDLSRFFWLPPQQRQVGLVFQDFQLIPELNVMDNIALPQFFSHWRLTDTQKAKLQSKVRFGGKIG